MLLTLLLLLFAGFDFLYYVLLGLILILYVSDATGNLRPRSLEGLVIG